MLLFAIHVKLVHELVQGWKIEKRQCEKRTQ